MTADVLVMCPSCARPQFPASACVACVGALPAAEPSAPAQAVSPRDQLLRQYEPFLEATLGRGRTALLSERRFEWKETPAAPALQIELARVSRVRMETRPIWEALMFAPLFLGLVFTPSAAARALGLGLVALALVACFAQRRYAMEWEVGQHRIKLVMGFGRAGTPAVHRIQSVWTTLSQELSRRRIPVVNPA